MSKFILIVFVSLFIVHFVAEIFVENKELQKQINNLVFIGLALWFPMSMLLVFIFGA